MSAFLLPPENCRAEGFAKAETLSFGKTDSALRRELNRGKYPLAMNPLEHRIVDILEAVTDRHATAFNVFNVLNRDGYSVTKLEFEKACQQLHDDASVSYRPIRSPLVDIPIGTLDLLIRSPSRI